MEEKTIELKGLWQFSPSSEPLLQRFKEIAAKNTEPNEWAKVFKKTQISDENKENGDQKQKDIKANDSMNAMEVEESANTGPICEKLDENFTYICELITNDLDTKFSTIVTECLKNERSLTEIAKTIPETAAERFYKQIYNSENVDLNFLVMYFKNYLPTFLTRAQPWFSIDMLVIASQKYNQLFKNTFLPTFLTLEAIPNSIFNDYVQTLKPEEKEDLLKYLPLIQLSDTNFKHHLNSIHNLCKDTDEKTYLKYISKILINTSSICVSDINYGRLLYFYLTNLSKQKYNYRVLVNLVDKHMSAMKRPCQNALKKLKSELITEYGSLSQANISLNFSFGSQF